MAVTKAIIEQLADSNTALVCNALDALGVPPHTYYMDGTIRSLSPELPPLVGEAITIKLDSSSPGETAAVDDYWQMLEEIERSSLPRAIIVQTVGSDPNRECVMGDGMAKTFVSVGAVGLVTDGGIRDIAGIVDQAFRIFGRGPVIQHTPLRWSGLGEPVVIGGIAVRTGDLIHGDRGGCIVIPEEAHSAIVKACQLVSDFEKTAHVTLRQTGIRLPDKKKRVDEAWNALKNKIRAIP